MGDGNKLNGHAGESSRVGAKNYDSYHSTSQISSRSGDHSDVLDVSFHLKRDPIKVIS